MGETRRHHPWYLDRSGFCLCLDLAVPIRGIDTSLEKSIAHEGSAPASPRRCAPPARTPPKPSAVAAGLPGNRLITLQVGTSQLFRSGDRDALVGNGVQISKTPSSSSSQLTLSVLASDSTTSTTDPRKAAGRRRGGVEARSGPSTKAPGSARAPRATNTRHPPPPSNITRAESSTPQRRSRTATGRRKIR